MDPPNPCPACQRPNAPHRASCLYCGKPLTPTAAGPVAKPAPEVPPDLDQLLRKAMAGQGTRGLKEALTAFQSQRAEGEPVVSPVAPPGPAAPLAVAGAASGAPPAPAAPRPAAGAAPLGPIAAEPPARVAEATPRETPGATLRRVSTTLHDLARRVERGDRAVAEALDQAIADLGQVRGALGPAAGAGAPALVLGTASAAGSAPVAGTAPVAVDRPEPLAAPPLPGGRPPWVLVIEGPNDPDRAPALAAALATDGVTARMLAGARTPRAVARGADRAALEARLGPVHALGLRAAVMGWEALRAMAPPELGLGREPDGRWRLAPEPLWLPEDPTRATPEPTVSLHELRGVTLALPGEVLVRRARKATDKGVLSKRAREVEWRDLGEQRRVVVDLHAPDRFVRLVEGWTSLDGLVPEGSARPGWPGLIDALPALFPGVRVLGSRTCPAEQPSGGESAVIRVTSGWPTWEEHTRVCRVLYGVSA